MQVHGVAVGGVLHAVYIRQGEDAVRIGIRALVRDAVALKVEAVGAVGEEGHLGALVIRDDGHALGRGRFGRLFFLFALRLGIGIQVGDDGAVRQGPDRLGDQVQHLGELRGIVAAVLLVLAHGDTGGILHLHGIGVQAELRHRVSRGRGGDGAVAVIHISALGRCGQDHAQARVVADLAALAGLHAVGIGEEAVVAGAVQGQGEIQEEAAVVVHQALGDGGKELIVLHQIHVAVILVEGNGVGAAQSGLAVLHDGAVRQGPGRLGHEVQHLGILVGVVDAVLIVLAHLHAHGFLHLHGIGVQLHLKDRVSGNGGDDSAGVGGGVAALGVHGDDLAKARVVADLAALAGLQAVGLGEKLIAAGPVQGELHVEEEPAVIVGNAGEVGAEELVVPELVQVAVVLVIRGSVGALELAGVAALPVGNHGAVAQGQHAGEHDGGNRHRNHQDRRHDGVDQVALLAGGGGVLVEAADDVVHHGDQHQDGGGQGHVNGLFAAVTGVVVGHDAGADALHPVAHQQHGRRGKAGDHSKGGKAHQGVFGELMVEPDGQGRKHQPAQDQGQDQGGIQAAEGVVVGGKAEKEQDQGQDAQNQGNGADGQVQAAFFLVFRHDYCLLSFLAFTMDSAVKATVPTKFRPIRIRRVNTHHTTEPEEPESLVMPLRSALLTYMKSFL